MPSVSGIASLGGREKVNLWLRHANKRNDEILARDSPTQDRFPEKWLRS